jgi:hypothetical protein
MTPSDDRQGGVACFAAADVDRRTEKDPFLKAKVRTTKLRLAGFCSEMDDRFWESAKRLTRPTPPVEPTE